MSQLPPEATEHSGPCTRESLCDSCVADLALLAGTPDPLAAIAGPRLPEGWSVVRDRFGRRGASHHLYDADGNYRGSYGWVQGSYISGAKSGWWQAGAHEQRSEQACIDYIASGDGAA